MDAIAKGSLMGKNIEIAFKLLKEMKANAYQWIFKYNTSKKTIVVHELDVLTLVTS